MNAVVRVQKRAFGVIAVASANGSDVSRLPKSAFQSAICSDCHECESFFKWNLVLAFSFNLLKPNTYFMYHQL